MAPRGISTAAAGRIHRHDAAIRFYYEHFNIRRAILPRVLSGELKRIHQSIDPRLEMTEICYRTLQAGGPALLFNNPKGSSIPVLGNLFGTTKRVAIAMGAESVEALRDVGQMLAFLKAPELPDGFGDLMDNCRPSGKCATSIRARYDVRQFAYTKFVIVTDDDINVCNWNEVIWAISTRMDPVRDSVLVENTPIDYLDFASPVSGLGSKIGFEATNKWPAESSRRWGRPISMSAAVIQRVDALWKDLGIP